MEPHIQEFHILQTCSLQLRFEPVQSQQSHSHNLPLCGAEYFKVSSRDAWCFENAWLLSLKEYLWGRVWFISERTYAWLLFCHRVAHLRAALHWGRLSSGSHRLSRVSSSFCDWTSSWLRSHWPETPFHFTRCRLPPWKTLWLHTYVYFHTSQQDKQMRNFLCRSSS